MPTIEKLNACTLPTVLAAANADVPHTPLRFAFAMAAMTIMLTVFVSLVRDPNSKFSRMFVRAWPKPLTAGQTALCRAIGIFGIVITFAVAVGLTIDIIDRGFSD